MTKRTAIILLSSCVITALLLGMQLHKRLAIQHMPIFATKEPQYVFEPVPSPPPSPLSQPSPVSQPAPVSQLPPPPPLPPVELNLEVTATPRSSSSSKNNPPEDVERRQRLAALLQCSSGEQRSQRKRAGACIDAKWYHVLTTRGDQPWLCESVMRYSLRAGIGEDMNQDVLRKYDAIISDLCGTEKKLSRATMGKKEGATATTVVVAALHDGLGNQMFQAAFAFLLHGDLHSSKPTVANNPLVFIDATTALSKTKSKPRGTLNRSTGATALLRQLYPALQRKSILIGEHKSPAESDSAIASCVENITRHAGEREERRGNSGFHLVSDKRGSSMGFLQQFRRLTLTDAGDSGSPPECIFVDGFFQEPFLYERRRQHVQELLQVYEEPSPRALAPKRGGGHHEVVHHAMLTALDHQMKGGRDAADGALSLARRSSKSGGVQQKRSANSRGGLRLGSEREAVVHIRTCLQNRGSPGMQNLRTSFYPPLPASYFIEALGGRRRQSWDAAWIVAPPSCARSELPKEIQEAFPEKKVRVYRTQHHDMSAYGLAVARRRDMERARHARDDVGHKPRGPILITTTGNNATNSAIIRVALRHAASTPSRLQQQDDDLGWMTWAPAGGVVADLLFMRWSRGLLVLSVGSFSFWAGWLSKAREVVVPLAGRQTQYHLSSTENGRFSFIDMRMQRATGDEGMEGTGGRGRGAAISSKGSLRNSTTTTTSSTHKVQMLRQQLGGARSLKAVLSRSNPTREALAEVELAAKVAVCQSAAANAKKNFFEHESRGRKPQERVFDCWRFATAANSIQQVKIFGERRSGSRFIKQLVSLNIDASLLSLEGETKGKLPPVVDELYKRDFSRSLGWRHACAPSPAQLDAAGVSFEMLHRTLFVLVAKNPYAWLVSLFRSQGKYRNKFIGSGGSSGLRSTFEDFTRSPWVVAGKRENFASCQRNRATSARHTNDAKLLQAIQQKEQVGRRLQRGHEPDAFLNPVVMWNQKHRSYLRLTAPFVLRARYEDVLKDPEEFLAQAVRKFGLRRKNPFLVNVLHGTSNERQQRRREAAAAAAAAAAAESSLGEEYHGATRDALVAAAVRASTMRTNKTFDTYREFYLHGGWQRAFLKEGGVRRLKWIHRYLDFDLVREWGYEPLGFRRSASSDGSAKSKRHNADEETTATEALLAAARRGVDSEAHSLRTRANDSPKMNRLERARAIVELENLAATAAASGGDTSLLAFEEHEEPLQDGRTELNCDDLALPRSKRRICDKRQKKRRARLMKSGLA